MSEGVFTQLDVLRRQHPLLLPRIQFCKVGSGERDCGGEPKLRSGAGGMFEDGIVGKTDLVRAGHSCCVRCAPTSHPVNGNTRY
jgi:hypothetical protein